MTKNLLLLLIVMGFLFWKPADIAHGQTEALVPVFVLLKAEANNPQGLVEVQAFITANQGRTVHLFPFQALIAKVPTGAIDLLPPLPGVAAVLTGPVESTTMDVYGPEARLWAATWNDLIAPAPLSTTGTTILAEHPFEGEHAFVAPDEPPAGVLGQASGGPVTPGYYQTSEYMTGSVAVSIILVESNGVIDPSTEDWLPEEKEVILKEIVVALDWWAELEPRANLSFVYDNHLFEPLPTKVEPITRPYPDQQYWIAEAMEKLGYNSISYFTRVRDYNNDLRQTYQTDWAFTIFVVDSSTDSDNRFSDGYFAYAYLGGPFLVMTYGNNGYGSDNMDAVAAHEIGHIFHAQDQYANAVQDCTKRSGYLSIENQNSQYGGCLSNQTSIMRGQVSPYRNQAIDVYAAGQVGWRDSDADDILDPLDTDLPIGISNLSQEGNRLTVSGDTKIIPYPSPSRNSVTINRLTAVQYRLDAGEWQAAQAEDGRFDDTFESYHLTLEALLPGLHNVEVAALDSAGNVSAIYAGETIRIFDPVDGPLNTDLYPPNDVSRLSQTATLKGAAYHMSGGQVVKVEYRLNDGPWQPVQADDGLFDNDYETFTLTFDPQILGPGKHLIEARATTADNYVEVNFASQEIEFADVHSIFLPFVIKN